MQSHAIIELEEGALNVVVGTQDGPAIRVTKSQRLGAPDLGRDALTKVLRTIGSGVLDGVAGVHVVLGDRRIQHFLSTVPRMAAGDVVAFVVREALRLTGQQAAADTLVATRLVGTRPGNRLVLGTTAVARSVVEPVRQACEAAGLRVLGLYSMEACMALAAKGSDGSVALLECNAGRARFVLCDAGCPVQVRRFLVGDGEGNPEALAAQLAMELPRTLEWLRETGHGMPATLVLGSRVELDEASLDGLRVEPLRTIATGRSPVAPDPDLPAPSLGVGMLLERLCRGDRLPSLLDAPHVVLPRSPAHRIGLAAALLAGFACSWRAVVDGTRWLAVGDEVAAARTVGEQLAMEVGRSSAEPEAGPDLAATRLHDALVMRRPTSRLVAQVSNAAEDGLFLEKLDFASTEPVIVTGWVGGRSRQQALATLAVFSRRLRDLPYLEGAGQDEIAEVPGQRNRYRFRLGFAWRNS